MPKFLVEWNLPPELTRDKYDNNKKKSLDIYAKLPNCDWISTYLSDDMSKCYCLYEAESEEAVIEARDAVNAKIDKIVRVDELTETDYRE